MAVFFGKNEVEINCVDFCHDSAKQASLMALTAPKINCVDFCHDSAKQASLMALAAPKVENLEDFENFEKNF